MHICRENINDAAVVFLCDVIVTMKACAHAIEPMGVIADLVWQ